MGALAIANEDPTGISARILGYTIPNAAAHCAFAVQTDGTWTETPDYVSLPSIDMTVTPLTFPCDFLPVVSD